MARICIDLDGVVCNIKMPHEKYSELLPVDGAKEKLQQLKQNGHYIILCTARHMKTTGANVGLAMARIGKDTLDWLKYHEIPYDEIFFGKPWADVYIDDNALRFEGWHKINGDGSQLPMSNEKLIRGDK